MSINETFIAGVLGLVTLVSLCCLWLLPGGVLALRRRAHGEMQVDLRPGYSPDPLYRVLQLYGPDGIRSFRILLLADMVFPAVYGAFLFILGDLLTPAHPAAAIVCAMAVAAACFDYLENIFLFMALRRLPLRHDDAARAAGVCTTLKTVSIIATLGMLALLWLSPSAHG